MTTPVLSLPEAEALAEALRADISLYLQAASLGNGTRTRPRYEADLVRIEYDLFAIREAQNLAAEATAECKWRLASRALRIARRASDSLKVTASLYGVQP